MSYAGYRHRGGRGGGRRHGRGAAFWDDPCYGGLPSPRPAPDEKIVALGQSIAATFAAARLVAGDGSPEKAAKAAELLSETRKGLYRILIDETA
jgi:hypothetical protein